MSQSQNPIRDLVVGIIGDYLGQELTKELGLEVASRIIQGVLMTRQGAGLSDKPGQSTSFSRNERRGDIEQPGKEESKDEEPKTKTVAIVSQPFDDPTKPIDEQDGSRPIIIRKRI